MSQNTEIVVAKPDTWVEEYSTQVSVPVIDKARIEKSIYYRVWESNEIGFTKTENGIQVLGKRIAEVLGYEAPEEAVDRHCRNVVRLKIHDGKQHRWVKMISEGDVLRLITHSTKPEAKKFEAWVMEEILPSVMKTGRYISRKLNPSEEGQAIIDAANAKKAALVAQIDFFPTKVKFEFEKPVAAKLGEERSRLAKEGVEFATETDFLGYIVSKYFEEVA